MCVSVSVWNVLDFSKPNQNRKNHFFTIPGLLTNEYFRAS